MLRLSITRVVVQQPKALLWVGDAEYHIPARPGLSHRPTSRERPLTGQPKSGGFPDTRGQPTKPSAGQQQACIFHFFPPPARPTFLIEGLEIRNRRLKPRRISIPRATRESLTLAWV
ncbi:unnamed protein product [Scytosiphon promiscuus]